MTEINTSYGTSIVVDEVAISVFGGVKLKKVLITDHHKDTLIFANRIKTDIIGIKKIIEGDLVFNSIRLEGVLFNLKTYKKEKNTNLDVFIEAFETGKPATKPFLMTAREAFISNGHFILTDENRAIPKDVDFTKLYAQISDFKILGPEVQTNINQLTFKDHRGVFVKKLSGKFSYNKKQIQIRNLDLATKESILRGDVALHYKIEDFSDFNNKVHFDITLRSAKVASNDIRFFYNELGRNLNFVAKSRINGTLNNLKLTNLLLYDDKGSKIKGTLNFRNLFPSPGQQFFMKGEFQSLLTSYDNLVTILPNVLGKTLPLELKKLGNVAFLGSTELTRQNISATFKMKTDIGDVASDIVILNMNQSQKAKYKGNITLSGFDLGVLLDQKTIGKTDANIQVDGVGFTNKSLHTNVSGSVSSFNYNNYTFQNISLDGLFKMPFYKGKLAVNDPNLEMNFEGIVDLSGTQNRYDFDIDIEKAHLHQLHFDSEKISNFKGQIKVEAVGNSIDNIYGNVLVSNVNYQNTKNSYSFDDIQLSSEFDEAKVRTITLASTDVGEGQVVGKYKFNQLYALVQNSLGSLYGNYKPIKVDKGQYLKFDLTIHDKIVEAVFPAISMKEGLKIKGNIDADKNAFKMNFLSNTIQASGTTLDNIRVAVDNNNPLYNAYIELDSIKTGFYKIRDFSLINVTMKDSLKIRTEFKGGNNGEDIYNLNLFHTIDKNNNNVLGFSKSELKFKEYTWNINANDTQNNQIIFDKKLQNFAINDIVLTHESQEIDLSGLIKGTTYKDLHLNFKNVDLKKITPVNKKFEFNGNISGQVNFEQEGLVYKPTAAVFVDRLRVNNVFFGNLSLDIKGDQSFKKFELQSHLENDNFESFSTSGNFEIVNNETVLDLDIKLDKFNLAFLTPVAGDVLSNIRGLVSGNTKVQGTTSKPDINGRLYLEGAGINIPYLNVDYELNDKTIVDLSNEKFLFRNNAIFDTKYKTTGLLNGIVEHNQFSDWKLDLKIDSKRFLALDTKDSDDAAYFGTAFIDGSAQVKGPVDALFIKVVAKSEKGTSVKIPINNAESVSENGFIHFITAKEKSNNKFGIVEKIKDYNGLELEFDFDINPDAEVEVILDRNTGHGMKGKGYGSLLFKINTLGKFNMWGDFQAYEGTYNFKYGGLIDKKFAVKKGGSIIWEGNPMKAQLNLEAVYKTSANPSVLLENSSLNSKVPVEVVVGIRGDLARPEPDFTILFPTVSSVLESEIQYKLNDKDTRYTQALYLLSSGSFLSTEGISQSDFSSSLFETASGLLGDLIQSKDDKFKVGVNVITADRRVGRETDGRFVATVSSKLNERITFNGKVGVPFGGVNESAIVGDVEILYRVNETGNFNLRLFNKENDINYIGQGIGYTQGVGISYDLDFDTFKEFVAQIFKRHKLVVSSNSSEVIHDSALPPDYINFNKSKKPPKEKPKNNQEGIVPEEE
ncbi:translocation/assembly module TamB domain-containing protein [Flavobacterium sp. TSSA_36]|uniref:translocation/assembly module TamB domain-containing protein n=1 Tax=Flavobacterium sp. TSSA_36 TaxID=3447669 RepID=UPI003F2E6645